MNIIVKTSQNQVSIEEALAKNYIKISGNSLISTNQQFKICPSTNLFDLNGDEIFLDDLLIDQKGNIQFHVIQFYSTFYIKRVDSSEGCVIDTLANFKLGNHVPFYKL